MSLSGLRGTEIGAMVVCLSLLGVVCYVLSDDVDLVVGGFVFKLLRRGQTEYEPVDHWRHVGSLSCGRAQGCGAELVDDVCGDRRLRPKAYEGTSTEEQRR